MKTYAILLSLYILFFNKAKAQYTFDAIISYQVRAVFKDTTNNYNQTVGSRFAYKNGRIIGIVLHEGSPEEELTIMDLENEVFVRVMPKAEEKTAMAFPMTGAKRLLEKNPFKANLNEVFIGKYLCTEWVYEEPEYSFRIWSTKQLTDIPANAYMATGFYSILPDGIGLPVKYIYHNKTQGVITTGELKEMKKDLTTIKMSDYKID